MSDEGDVDATRKAVKTFVPAYQKNEWKRHADELDMSQSEFVRTMVQAGRRDFDLGGSPSDAPRAETAPGAGGVEGSASDSDAGTSSGDEIEDRVLSILSATEHLSWDELIEELTSDVEDRLDETIQRLQTDNRVRYSGRHGGYALVEESDGN